MILAIGLVGCAKPEPEPAAVGEAPSVVAPELEQVEYVDPVEAARAQARARAGQASSDASWREGFDRRAPTDGDEAESPDAGADEPAADEQPERGAPTEDAKLAAPPATATPTFTEPLPSIDGTGPPTPGAARHPDDAVPPPR